MNLIKFVADFPDEIACVRKFEAGQYSKPVNCLIAKGSDKILTWVHTMISNAKRSLPGVHHMASKKYIQNYLDEFCYKVNRRYYGEELFDRLLIACVSCRNGNFINHFR